MRGFRAWVVTGGLLLLIGVAPIAVTMAGGAIAGGVNCRIDEGDVHPCLVLGHDWGSILYAMGEAFWLELLAIWLVPVGLIALAVGTVRYMRRDSR